MTINRRIRVPVDLPDDESITLEGVTVKRGRDIQQSTYTFNSRHAEGVGTEGVGSFGALDQVFADSEGDAGIFTGGTAKSGSSGMFDQIAVTYEDIISAEYPVKRYNKKTTVIPRDLSYKEDSQGELLYRTWWNNHIIKKTGTTETITDATWKEVKDGTPGEAKTEFKWHKSTAPIGTAWEMHLKCDKPGVTSYLIPTSEVVETILFKEDDADDYYAAPVGEKQAPEKTFGLEDGDSHWLVYGSSTQAQGPWFVTTNTYRFAEKWDNDLYGE